MKSALVCGAGGFIGAYLVKRLKDEGFWVRGVDIKNHEFWTPPWDDFVKGDLRNPDLVSSIYDREFNEVYQFAADMGGAGYIFTGENDANVMHNSALCNLNVLHEAVKKRAGKIFFSSSACVYPYHIQLQEENHGLKENTAYPALPDSDYGWEKLFSERLYQAYYRNYKIETRIARFHNVFGPFGTWTGGKEKAPAAMCRKVAMADDGGTIEVWGDGKQTRTFLYIDECIEGVRRLMNSDLREPVNIGSDELISINDLAFMAADIANKKINLNHIKGPEGVRGRASDNAMIFEKLGWRPSRPLHEGIEKTYRWIDSEVRKGKK